MAANTMSVSSQVALTARSGSSKPFTGQPIKPARAVAVPRSRSHVVKASAQDETKGPSKIALGLFGALAAAQLALIPGPAEAFSLFPKTALSQTARDQLNKKTDNLPTLAETGKELVGGGDPIGANSPKDLGKAIDKATPDVDLTKNPKSLRQDAVRGAKNALPDVSAVPTREEIIANAKAKGNKGGSVAKKASKGGNPLSGIGTNLPQAGGAPKKASKAASNLGSKASKTANKAAAKTPSAKDIQSKLGKPLGTLGLAKELANKPKELANSAKVNTPNADSLASKAKAALPSKPAGDLKSKVKNTPSATIGLPTFELSAGLQGQDNQSENYPSPAKGYTPMKPNDNIGPIPDKITSPIDSSNLPNPRTAGQQAPGTDLGISKATDAIPDLGKAAKSLDSATPSLPNPSEAAKGLPNPAEAAKGLDNPFDSVKSLFGQ
ncbi:hypothetical protein ABBQ32_010538 [Trebouxia sp. C0010 RCD-2024]